MFEDENEHKDKEIRVLFHQSIVGGIIGKGGAKVREIREETGTIITAFPNVAPQSSDRVVSIKGLKDSVLQALALCLEVARDRVSHGFFGTPAVHLPDKDGSLKKEVN